jgi:3-hydroxyisobutyrate dehydrogenase-like beta-hydroxyacid dehydrogenase
MGARVLTTLKGRSAASAQRVKRAELEVIDDEDGLVCAAGFILSIVPPGQASAVADRFRAALGRALEKPVFVECNAISPPTVKRIAASLSPSECPFIDAGIIGGPPPPGRIDKGPRIYASGPESKLLLGLRKYGLDIVVIDGPIGAASGLKMAYAGLTKGMIALGAAVVFGASREGLASALHDELARSQPNLLSLLEARVPDMFRKAYRWVDEMGEIAEFLGSAGAGATIYEGAARLYAQISADQERFGEQAESQRAVKTFLGS